MEFYVIFKTKEFRTEFYWILIFRIFAVDFYGYILDCSFSSVRFFMLSHQNTFCSHFKILARTQSNHTRHMFFLFYHSKELPSFNYPKLRISSWLFPRL